MCRLGLKFESDLKRKRSEQQLGVRVKTMRSLSKKLNKGTPRYAEEGEGEGEEEELNELQDGFETALTSKQPLNSAWASGGHQRDHLLQLLLNLVSNFGVYHTTTPAAVEKDDSTDHHQEGSHLTHHNDQDIAQEIFYKSTYALENVNGLRQ